MYPGSFSANSESLTALGCSPLRMGADSQERFATLRDFNSTSLWCSYCCRKGSCPLLDEFNSNVPKTRYSFSRKNCHFWKWPQSKHWRTAWTDFSKKNKLFNVLMQNWLFSTMVYIYFHFLILFSRIALRSDWWVSFVVEYMLFATVSESAILAKNT